MLYCGEQIGNGTLEPQVDIAVDPLDGTTSIALVSSCAGDQTVSHNSCTCYSQTGFFNASRHIPLQSAWSQHECCYIACLRAQGLTSEPFWCRAAMEQSV